MPPDPPREQGPEGLATPTQINATPTSKIVENPGSICIFVKQAIWAVVQTKIGNFLSSLLFRIVFTIQKHPTSLLRLLKKKALQKNNDGEAILPFVPQKMTRSFKRRNTAQG